MLYIIEKDGRRRTAEEYTCENCSNLFLRRINVSRQSRFCCKQCGYTYRKKDRVKLKCETCGKVIFRTLSKLKMSKHKKYFCDRNCKEIAQSLIGGCIEIQPDHYGTSDGRSLYRNLIDNTINVKCADCNESKRYLLLVHHIDGNRDNNDILNLEILCNNCHIKRHLYFNNSEWKYNTKKLTPRNKIIEL